MQTRLLRWLNVVVEEKLVVLYVFPPIFALIFEPKKQNSTPLSQRSLPRNDKLGTYTFRSF